MCMYMFLPKFMCTMCMYKMVKVRGFHIPGIWSFRPLLAISYGSGNWTRAFCKRFMCSDCWPISLTPFSTDFFFHTKDTRKILTTEMEESWKWWVNVAHKAASQKSWEQDSGASYITYMRQLHHSHAWMHGNSQLQNVNQVIISV